MPRAQLEHLRVVGDEVADAPRLVDQVEGGPQLFPHVAGQLAVADQGTPGHVADGPVGDDLAQQQRPFAQGMRRGVVRRRPIHNRSSLIHTEASSGCMMAEMRWEPGLPAMSSSGQITADFQVRMWRSARAWRTATGREVPSSVRLKYSVTSRALSVSRWTGSSRSVSAGERTFPPQSRLLLPRLHRRSRLHPLYLRVGLRPPPLLSAASRTEARYCRASSISSGGTRTLPPPAMPR